SSYQIAIADMDPYYALQLRRNPDMMMQQQRDALKEGGAAQSKRSFNNAPDSAKRESEKPATRRMLDDESKDNPRDAHPDGLEPTSMVGYALHKQLEKATGMTYEVIASDDIKFSRPAQGEFKSGVTPNDRIGAALDAGYPVIIGMLKPNVHATVLT